MERENKLSEKYSPQTQIIMQVKPIKRLSAFKDTKLGKNWEKLTNVQFLHNETTTHKWENPSGVMDIQNYPFIYCDLNCIVFTEYKKFSDRRSPLFAGL